MQAEAVRVQQDAVRGYGAGSHGPPPPLSHRYGQDFATWVVYRGGMSEGPYTVTVFRSMDSSASEDAQSILDALNEAGIEGVVLDEDAPGVLEGTWEVRVAPEYESRALTLIEALNQPEPARVGDPSADLNLVTIFTGMGTTAEIEALSIQAVLQSNGIDAVIEGASELPNLPFRVKVPQIERERAEAALAEARAAGPEAAEEASQA